MRKSIQNERTIPLDTTDFVRDVLLKPAPNRLFPQSVKHVLHQPHEKLQIRRITSTTSHQSLVLLHTPNARPNSGEFFLDAFVAAVDVIDTIDKSFALGDQRGQNQGSARAKIGSDDVGAG